MAEPIGTDAPEPRLATACDEGGEAPCSAHLLDEPEPVTDGPPADVVPEPADPA